MGDRAQPQALTTQALVLAAARAIAVVEGFGALTTRRVGAAAGVSHATANAFGGMTGLKRQLVVQALAPLATAFDDAAPTLLADRHDLILALFDEEPGLSSLVVHAASHMARHQLAARQQLRELGIMLGEALARHGASISPAALTVERLIAFYFGAALQLALDPAADRGWLRAVLEVNVRSGRQRFDAGPGLGVADK